LDCEEDGIVDVEVISESKEESVQFSVDAAAGVIHAKCKATTPEMEQTPESVTVVLESDEVTVAVAGICRELTIMVAKTCDDVIASPVSKLVSGSGPLQDKGSTLDELQPITGVVDESCGVDDVNLGSPHQNKTKEIQQQTPALTVADSHMEAGKVSKKSSVGAPVERGQVDYSSGV
jgi:hypothetical protein